MNRGYTAGAYLAKVAQLRQIRPDIALATDFIVGFPGETEKDFAETLQLLDTVRFHSSFSFKYSDRPQARAATFPDKIAEEIKGERLSRLQSLQNDISLQWNFSMMNKEVEVLVEQMQSQQGRGRSSANQVVHFHLQADQAVPAIGNLVRVQVEHAGPHSLRGVMLP